MTGVAGCVGHIPLPRGFDESPRALTVEAREELFHQLYSASMFSRGSQGPEDPDAVRSEIAEAEKKIKSGEATHVVLARGTASFILEPHYMDAAVVGVRRQK